MKYSELTKDKILTEAAFLRLLKWMCSINKLMSKIRSKIIINKHLKRNSKKYKHKNPQTLKIENFNKLTKDDILKEATFLVIWTVNAQIKNQ